MSHFEGNFEGAKTFLTPSARDNLGVKKVEAPSKCPEKWLIKLLSHKKNHVPKFLKQRDIGNFMYPSAVVYCCCVLLSVVGCSCVLLCVVVC
jgi:hypothetical protein